MKKHNIATRMLSMLLAAVMLASTFSFTAFADDPDLDSETTVTEEVTTFEEGSIEVTIPEEDAEEASSAGDPTDEEETEEEPTDEEEPKEEAPAEEQDPAEEPAAGEEAAPEATPVYATLADFEAACDAMGDTDDLESVRAALDRIEAVYNALSDEDKAAVADMWTYIQSYAASFSAGNPDTGIETLASGYDPVTNVGIYPDTKPAGNTATGKVRESGQSLTMKVGQRASFLLGAPTNTLFGGSCGHTIAVYNPSDYCDISLVDNSGHNLVGNPIYVAGNNNGTRVFDTQFEALKPGISSDVRVCYYANFGIVFTNPNLTSAYVACPWCGRSCLVYKDVKWYRYNDVFGITVNADYVLNYDANDGTVTPASERKTVASTTCIFDLPTPTRDGYTFVGWAESKDAKTGEKGTYTLTWSTGFGSYNNPVSKTLYAVWEETKPTVPDAPKRDDLYGILRDFVQVECVSLDAEGNPLHAAKTYNTRTNDLDGKYEAEVGEVYDDSGTWKVDVTLNGDVYAAMYSSEPNFGTGTRHSLAPDEDETQTITLTWNAESKKWTSGVAKGTILAIFQVVCKENEPDPPQPTSAPALTGFTKERVTDETTIASLGLAGINTDTPVKLGTGETATLLYAITVEGEAGAKFTVNELSGAALVAGSQWSGEIPANGSDVVIYVTMTFGQDDITEDGQLSNTAAVTPGEDTDPENPGPATEETGANKQFKVNITFVTDDGKDLDGEINGTYDEGSEYHYPLPGANAAAFFAMRSALDSIPQTLTQDGKTYLLDLAATPKSELDKLSSTGITADVNVQLVYSLDEKGGSDPDKEEGGPDGIPDKYEVKVTYQAENGTLSLNGVSGATEISIYVPLYKDGDEAKGYATAADGGIYEIKATEVPAGKPAKNYKEPGIWTRGDEEIGTPNEQTISEDTIFTLTYTRIQIIVLYTDGVEDEEVFADQSYEAEAGDATPAFEGTPAREGYAFTGWTPEAAKTVDPADAVDGVITYTAQWEKNEPETPEEPGEDDPTPTPVIPGTTDPTPDDPPPDDPTPPEPAPVPAAVPVVPAPVVPAAPAEPETEIPEEETPLAPAAAQPAAPASSGVEEIGEEETPLAGLGGAAWALLNLILLICTALASILLLIGYAGRKEKELKDDEGNTVLGADGKPVYEWTKERKGGLRLFSILPAVTAIVMFLLTEDMRLPMIIVDRWTIVMALIAVMQLCVCVLARKKKEDLDENLYGARA